MSFSVSWTELALPTRARDIADDLMKEFAFLSGGRGKDNGWIITLPENSHFNQMPEEVVTKVLTYLTRIPRQRKSDSKFILILDRRLDTWTSVKMTLQRIAVVMLSSVSDLLTYIDEKQLTPEFGGTLEYCHSEWVIFRTAIEGFALTVKEIAQMLQSFGMELAETELPDDTYSIERILALRTEKYYQLKEDITTVTKEGSMLLCSLEEPDREVADEEQMQEKSGDWETVSRLLAQLREMETAFDGFWEKHQLKMEQYLQLWKFEQHFQELSKAIEFLTEQQGELPDTGDNISQVKQRLSDMDNLDKMAQALECCDEGAYLLANQPMDKCQSREGAQNALQDIEKFLESSSPHLNADPQALYSDFELILTPELKARIQMVQIKLENVRSMFENRQACFKKLVDKQVRPVQLVAPRPENPPRSRSPLFSPKHAFLHVINELIETERVYVEELFTILMGYRAEMDNPTMAFLLPPLLQNRKDVLFGNMPEIYDFHNNTSCEGVEELQEALVAMLDLLKSGDIGELGKVLMQGSFSVWTGHRKGPTKMKDLARFKPMQRHLFLYEKALVFCKKREDHGDGYDKTSSYSFKHFLKAQTVDLKMAWLNEIRKILFKQQELIKVEKQPAPSCMDSIQLSPPLSEGKQTRASVSSEENDSERTSPVPSDSVASSQQSKSSRRLDDWSSHNYFSTCSDTEEEEGNQLSPGKYKALADCKKRDSEDLLVKNGDVIQLLHENEEGQWLVKNLNRRKEGWVPVNSLQIILGDYRFRNARVADAGLYKMRKLSSP
ncbi:hypothetical protein JD844_004077 [Phrynosoma platyrhinos]|uniref:MCF.2 cell line derived transforming sequence n=1 Tax=Phrynosoma platyrhinos TaxID=52577 RepID=A0ABQ7TLW8_PHRPL|nr:hypothetical protein JD844_004077 [Phrynosoma platyrhinos]